ncbi:TPA: hypothetical protein U2R10_000924 [Proteus mirabilis]|nr:hypothetical protein [Proteus mirabilis]MDC6011003.1 hypothetical protein [Proteus mirabilis]MDC6021576.1 hypothetical protein [Proteus mirabilis]HEK0520636.1 hypothetical protein [Proteus mirabilis]HEK2007082.1 hypothetical protein [Proteus mirabilis]HEK2652387.1 hypothetical protein [Proteus mirabilis]
MRDCMAVRITTPFLQLARQAARIAVSTNNKDVWRLASQLQKMAYGRKVCH